MISASRAGCFSAVDARAVDLISPRWLAVISDARRNDGGVPLAEDRASRFREFDAPDLDLPSPPNPLFSRGHELAAD